MGYIKVQTSVPVAQLDRASASGVEGLAFESRRAYHFFCLFSGNSSPDFLLQQLLQVFFTHHCIIHNSPFGRYQQ